RGNPPIGQVPKAPSVYTPVYGSSVYTPSTYEPSVYGPSVNRPSVSPSSRTGSPTCAPPMRAPPNSHSPIRASAPIVSRDRRHREGSTDPRAGVRDAKTPMPALGRGSGEGVARLVLDKFLARKPPMRAVAQGPAHQAARITRPRESRCRHREAGKQ